MLFEKLKLLGLMTHVILEIIEDDVTRCRGVELVTIAIPTGQAFIPDSACREVVLHTL